MGRYGIRLGMDRLWAQICVPQRMSAHRGSWSRQITGAHRVENGDLRTAGFLVGQRVHRKASLLCPRVSLAGIFLSVAPECTGSFGWTARQVERESFNGKFAAHEFVPLCLGAIYPVSHSQGETSPVCFSVAEVAIFRGRPHRGIPFQTPRDRDRESRPVSPQESCCVAADIHPLH